MGYPPQYPPQGQPPPIDNNMTMSIVAIFLFWPLAIPAIIFASQVNNKVATGDIAGAQESSKKAKQFSMIGIIVGVVCWVLFILFYLIVGIAAFSTSR